LKTIFKAVNINTHQIPGKCFRILHQLWLVWCWCPGTCQVAGHCCKTIYTSRGWTEIKEPENLEQVRAMMMSQGGYWRLNPPVLRWPPHSESWPHGDHAHLLAQCAATWAGCFSIPCSFVPSTICPHSAHNRHMVTWI
jgi:hypothetical protein